MASLQPEIIFSSYGIGLTNTVVATLVTDAILVLIVLLIAKNVKTIPGTLQSLAELGLEYLDGLTTQIAGKNANRIFPWFASFFIFILFANLIGLLPGFGTIGFYQMEPTGGENALIPFLRGATSDFNVTLALATVSLIATHVISIQVVGFKEYISRFLSFHPIYLFVGLLEIVSELSKLFSLSFRLFGNIYAGEVVIMTISGLTAFVAPIPFLMLEMIIALVQALVFAMLTMVFMSIMATPHHEGDH